MKKLITATAAAAFVLATGFAMAEETPAVKNTPAQQTKTQTGAGAAPMAGTTGAASAPSSTMTKGGESTIPGKPMDKQKDAQGK